MADNTAVPMDAAGQDVKTSDSTTHRENEVRMVEELLSRAKTFRRRFDRDWHQNYEFVLGSRQWPLERPRWRFTDVLNMTWATILTEVGIQSDARPKVDFVGMEETDIQFGEILSQIEAYNWEKYNNQQKIVANGLLDCKIYHVSHVLSEWNPELENGIGDLEDKLLDPFFCYWDPLATCEEDMRYFIYAVPTPVSLMKKMYGNDVKADVETVSGGMFGMGRYSVDSDKWRVNQLFRSQSGRASLFESERFGGEPMVLRTRCWIKDESIVEEKTQDEEGPLFLLKKKFPKGRYLEIVNNKVQQDRENGVIIDGKVVPYEDGEIPIARLVNYSYPREYAGENEVSMLRGPQMVINYIAGFIMDHFKQAGNPQHVLGKSNAEIADMITAEPGLVMVLNNYAEYRREQGLPLPANFIQLLDTYLGLFDKIQGIQDAARGAQQPGVTSGVFLEGVVEASQTRARLKNRNMDAFLQRLGQLHLSRYLQFYNVPRAFRITNKEGFPENVEFFISEQNGQKMANFNGQGGVAQIPIKGRVDVKIQSGSALPFAKAQKMTNAKELFAAGAIDREELLKSIDWPNYEKVLMRVEAAEAQQAQMQVQPK